MTFVKGQSGNPTGKAKGKIAIKTVVKQTLAERGPKAIEEMWEIIQGLKVTDVNQYLNRMEVLLPYIIKKLPAENNLTVSNGNLDTQQLREIPLEKRLQIKAILESGN